MLGLAYYEADRCAGCGQSLSVTAHPGADAKDWQAVRHVCSACEMVSIQQHAAEESKHTRAHLWTVEPVFLEP